MNGQHDTLFKLRNSTPNNKRKQCSFARTKIYLKKYYESIKGLLIEVSDSSSD